MQAATETTRAASLNVGDTIDLVGGRDSIVAMRPYLGPLTEMAGARIATLSRGREITLESASRFDRLIPAVSQ
jgi:hypothetical protein